MQEFSNSDLINHYFSLAVKNFKEEWFSGNADGQKWYEHVVNLPLKERYVYLIEILESQVNNGGFNQYFINGYGQFVVETIEVLKIINAKTTALIIEKAYQCVNVENFEHSVFRKKIISGEIESLYEDEDSPTNDYLNLLDDEYYEYDDNLEILLVDFLNKTPD